MPAKCTPTPGKITFGPTAPICGPKGVQQPGSPKAGGTSMKPTICDPEERTVNTAAECGGPEDFFQHSPVSASLPSLSCADSLALTRGSVAGTSGAPPATRP